MIEGIENATKVKPIESVPRAVGKTVVQQKASDHQDKVEKQEENKQFRIPEKLLDDFEQDLKLIHSVKIKFEVHGEDDRISVEVFNKETGELIRKVPQESFVESARKLGDVVGLIFSAKI